MANEITIIKGLGTVVLEVDGKKQFYSSEGDAFRLLDTSWEDLRFPAAGINPPGAVSDPSINTTTGLLDFSASAVNVIAFQVQMPHAWKEGSTVYPHVHWAPSTTNSGNVLWKLEYKVANVNEVFPAFSSLTALGASGGTADKHLITSFDPIPMTGKRISSMLLCKLSRMGDDNMDTFTGLAQLLEIDFHYEVDAFGSDEEFVK